MGIASPGLRRGRNDSELGLDDGFTRLPWNRPND